MNNTARQDTSVLDADPLISIHRFELLSIATKEGIWEYDFISKESFYNEGMTELFGYTHEEMADNETWWRNNLHPQDKKRMISELDEMMESTNKSVWWGKYQFRCKDGSYRLILDRLFLVRDQKTGKSLRMIGTMQDLTEIDALQQQLDNIRKQQHRAISRAIFQAEETERKYISEELNENINQVLAAINIDLAQAKKHVTKEGLNWLLEAQRLLINSIDGIRMLAKTLSPLVLKELGFKFTLEDLLLVLEEKSNIHYAIEVDEDAIGRRDMDTQTLLYRIAQHQIKNIMQHSNAQNVLLKIKTAGSKIKMSVYNDGTGINLKAIQYGKGFSNIQEKTEAFGGSFNLETAEGKPGFTLEVII
jgi:two-component system, NarL family, sensor histidine kinase UhpB